MDQWDRLADEQTIEKTISALKTNGIEAEVVENGSQAKEKVLELIPEDSEVMTMTSATLDAISVSLEINKNGSKFNPVRGKLYAMDRKTQAQEMHRLGAAPEYAIGSVQAVTEKGQVVVASNTGSQLPAYVYSALHVIWIVGTQKIVKNLDDAMKRLYEYTLPKESERVQKAYGMPKSNVGKLLIINKEVNPGRLTLVFVKEKLGF